MDNIITATGLLLIKNLIPVITQLCIRAPL